MNNNNTENHKNNTLPDTDIDEHGKGVLLVLVGIMVLLSFLMVNSYQIPNVNKNTNINSNNETSQPANEILNTSEQIKPTIQKIITTNTRMI